MTGEGWTMIYFQLMRGSLTIQGSGGGEGFGGLSGNPSDNAALAEALGTKVDKTGDVMSGGLVTTDRLTVCKTGQPFDQAGFEVADDPLNLSRRALFILPTDHTGRMYLGKSGLELYALNFQHVAVFENTPGFEMRSGLFVGKSMNTFINRGAGGTEIGANHPDDFGLDVFQDASFNTVNITHRALNVHRTRGITYFGTSTDRSNYEGANLGYGSGSFHLWSEKAGTGTARPLVLGFDSAERVRLDADGTKISGMTWFGSGDHTGPGTPAANGSFEHTLLDGTVVRILYHNPAV